MPCKEDRYDCGGRVYLIRQMPPTVAVPVQVYLAKSLGQSLFKAFASTDLSGEGALAMAVGILAERLDDAELMRHMRTVFRYVGILDEVTRICPETGSADEGIDRWFLGRTFEMWKVFAKALQVNFADFFGGNPLVSTLLSKLKGQLTSSLQTSTSTSGAPASANQSSVETSASSKTAPTP